MSSKISYFCYQKFTTKNYIHEQNFPMAIHLPKHNHLSTKSLNDKKQIGFFLHKKMLHLSNHMIWKWKMHLPRHNLEEKYKKLTKYLSFKD